MNTAMSNETEPVKVEGGHVSVTTISMSGPETSNGKYKYFLYSLIIYQHFADLVKKT